MTPEERAEQVVLAWNRTDAKPIRILIADAIREAVEVERIKGTRLVNTLLARKPGGVPKY